MEVPNIETVEKRVDYAAGTPENPFSLDDIRQKFFKLCRPIIDESTATEIVNYIDRIEFQEDISSLGHLLIGEAGG